MKRYFTIIITLLFSFNVFLPVYAEGDMLMGPVCREETYYEETGQHTTDNIVFNHHVRKSDVGSNVRFTVSVKQSMELSQGFSSDFDVVLANVSIDFHMKYVGEREISVEAEWTGLEKGKSYRLVYGNYKTTVNGYMVTKQSDCSEKKRLVSITGTHGSFQNAIEE